MMVNRSFSKIFKAFILLISLILTWLRFSKLIRSNSIKYLKLYSDNENLNDHELNANGYSQKSVMKNNIREYDPVGHNPLKTLFRFSISNFSLKKHLPHHNREDFNSLESETSEFGYSFNKSLESNDEDNEYETFLNSNNQQIEKDQIRIDENSMNTKQSEEEDYNRLLKSLLQDHQRNGDQGDGGESEYNYKTLLTGDPRDLKASNDDENHKKSFKFQNQDTFRRLLNCHYQSSLNNFDKNSGSDLCSGKDDSIILLGTVHFSRVTEGIFNKKASFPAGEAIWADALVMALRKLNYPFLVVTGPNHFETNKRLSKIYKILNGDSNVKMVIGDYLSIPKCFKDEINCVRSKSNLNGIPIHKLFVFDGFGIDVDHPLGRRWHLTFYPKEKEGFSYLGLTIEHYCRKFEFIPPSKRLNKIYILGKDRGYLYPPAPQLFRRDMWERISNLTGVGFTMGTFQKSLELERQQKQQKKDKDDGEASVMEYESLLGSGFDEFNGINDIGSQTRDQFINQIQNHRALIGLGWPVQPSTPLEALCVGTPFINPVWLGRRSISDRDKWHSQHPYLSKFDPPYVYNVQDKNEDDILNAIEMIMKTDQLQERFIPDDMKIENYLLRIKNLIEFDWENLSLTRTKK